MNLLYLILLFPLLGSLLLAFSQGRWSEKTSAIVGVGSIALAALCTVWITIDFFSIQAISPIAYSASQSLWHWMSVDDFSIGIVLKLDGLSLTMIIVVLGVGFLIHLFASWYMRGEEGYSRFFAYTNLFIANMLILVLADNLLLMYLGWEGVGLCSYLLIGFYYNNPNNGAAAMKAFIVTRIGDVFLAIGLFVLYAEFNTLNIQELTTLFTQSEKMAEHSTALTWAAFLLAMGAFGKSAQLPLQTWLADAMAGPTPVSALIHAATMVTAGVYLIARMNGLFLQAPDVLYFVAVIGTITLLLAGLAALAQTDIKRILAYSTMSQLGYMFLALGVQAWDAAIFHLVTHAFFKALLFLAAGSVIVACHHEQNIFKMGGLRKKLPVTFAAFLIGGSALSALPILTAGFYSKDAILWGAFVSGHSLFMVIGLVGAFITSIYTFRLIFLVFFGESKIEAEAPKEKAHTIPLVGLMILSTLVGAFLSLPYADVLPTLTSESSGKIVLEIISSVVALLGVFVAFRIYFQRCSRASKMRETASVQRFSKLLLNGWGFDFFYNMLFVKTYKKVAYQSQSEPLDKMMNLLPEIALLGNKGSLTSQNGYVRWYIASICIGAITILAILLWLN